MDLQGQKKAACEIRPGIFSPVIGVSGVCDCLPEARADRFYQFFTWAL